MVIANKQNKKVQFFETQNDNILASLLEKIYVIDLLKETAWAGDLNLIVLEETIKGLITVYPDIQTCAESYSFLQEHMFINFLYCSDKPSE